MPKFKRDLLHGTYLTAADMLSLLSQQQFKAAAMHGRILLAVQPPVAWLLDSCCVGRAAMQSAAPITVPAVNPNSSSGSSSAVSGGTDAQLAAAVLGMTGMNTAGPELWVQYRQHQQNVWAAQQRKASRSKRAAALIAALGQMDTEQDEEQSQMRLVQLSFQEAVFFSHVLKCCQVFAVDSSINAQEQGAAQQDAAAGPDSIAPAQQTADGPAAAQDGQQQQQGSAQSAQSAALLSGSELWQWCCQHSTGGAAVFAPQYAAYHHLRSLGWLPLPGLSYGADYVLYQLHPENAHSDFVVTVMVEGAARDAANTQVAPGQQQQLPLAPQQQEDVQEPGAAVQVSAAVQQPHQDAVQDGNAAAGAGQQGGSLPSTQLAWLDACIMHRLARQVLKEMMLLYVVVPAGVSLAEFDCIHSFQVREVLVQRWVPSEHREVK